MSYVLDRNVTHDGEFYEKWSEIKEASLKKALERFLVRGSQEEPKEEVKEPEANETPQEEPKEEVKWAKKQTGRKKSK